MNMTTKKPALYLRKNEKKYSPLFKLSNQSQLLNKIWKDAYRDDFPELLETFGFVTKTDLEKVIELINLGAHKTLLDIGCGKGGPGMYVAHKSSAKLIGMDIDEGAVEQAKILNEKLKLVSVANFKVGSFSDTALPACSVDAIMSIDALILAPDKNLAIMEMSRLLPRRSRLVFTTWDRPEIDLDSILKTNGFEIICHQECPDWKNRQLAVYQGILRQQNELREEIGDEAADILISEATEAPALLEVATRVLIAAQRN